MPEFDLLLDDDDRPLFPQDDPLTFVLPDLETGSTKLFHAVDRPVMPDDRYVNLGNQPRTYMIETMAASVVDDERKVLRDTLHQLLDEGVVTVDKMMEVAEWLTTQRDKARKRLAKQKLGRPTGGQSPSLPSSSTGRVTSEGGSF